MSVELGVAAGVLLNVAVVVVCGGYEGLLGVKRGERRDGRGWQGGGAAASAGGH